MKRLAPFAAALVAGTVGSPLAAQPETDAGRSAFDRQDYAAAADLWRQGAAAGSAEAEFGLGLLSDLGLGMPRNATDALRWYGEAACAGLPEAEFNVAVMLDAGTGVPADQVAAAVWYARAAASGHDRAQYNLGLIYEKGEGVPRNSDLARYWLGRAAHTLPAAAEHGGDLAAPVRSDRRLQAPEMAKAALIPAGDASKAELVWSGPPGPAGARYLVEIIELPRGTETWGRSLLRQSTEGSALALPLPGGTMDAIWRVTMIDRGNYAAGAWQSLGSGTALEGGGGPKGRVVLHVGARDRSAQWLAAELASSFWHSGLWVRTEAVANPARRSGVSYGFAQDAALAGDIAESLPALSAQDAALASGPNSLPGKIDVYLVGGPSTPETTHFAPPSPAVVAPRT